MGRATVKLSFKSPPAGFKKDPRDDGSESAAAPRGTFTRARARTHTHTTHFRLFRTHTFGYFEGAAPCGVYTCT